MSDLYVLFQVGNEDYGLPAADVVVMESFDGATRVPGAPAWVEGLVQIRGEVLPVIDLRKRFGLPPVDRSLDHRVVVIRHGGRAVGLLVDRAREVVSIARDALREPPETVARGSDRLIRQVAKAGERLVMLIDGARVIGEEILHGDGRDD